MLHPKWTILIACVACTPRVADDDDMGSGSSDGGHEGTSRNWLAYAKRALAPGAPCRPFVVDVDAPDVEYAMAVPANTPLGFVWSPDGTKLIYTVREATMSSWYLVDVSSAEPTAAVVIGSLPHCDRCVVRWSPDSTKVTLHGASSTDTPRDDALFVVDLSRGAPTMPVRLGGMVRELGLPAFAFSPDGSMLAFRECEYNHSACHLFVVDTTRAEPGALTAVHPTGVQFPTVEFPFQWSHDGETLFYESLDANGDVALFATHVSGASPGNTVRMSGDLALPGPGGKYIPGWRHQFWLQSNDDGVVLDGAAAGNSGIFWIDLRGGEPSEPIPLVSTPYRAFHVSPGARRLAWESPVPHDSTVGTLFVSEVGTAPSSLDVAGQSDSVGSVSFSPDERWLVFTDGASGAMSIVDASEAVPSSAFAITAAAPRSHAFAPDSSGIMLSMASLTSFDQLWWLPLSNGVGAPTPVAIVDANDGFTFKPDGSFGVLLSASGATSSDDRTLSVVTLANGAPSVTELSDRACPSPAPAWAP